ncbi:TPA: Coiled-coil flagellar protein [Trebouxia sp. C0004]
MAKEKKLLDEAKLLNEELLGQEQPSSRDADATQASYLESVPRLREDAEEAQAEVSRAQEQEQMKQIEVAELQRQRNELRQRLHEAEEAHRAVLLPQLEALNADITVLSADADAERRKQAASSREVADLKDKLQQVQAATHSLAEECASEAINLEKTAVGPDKTRRAADLLVNAVKGLQLQMEQAANKLQQQESRLCQASRQLTSWLSQGSAQLGDKLQQEQLGLQGFEAKAQALEASHVQASGAVDRSKISIEAKQRAEDDIRRDVEIAKLGAENASVERATIDMEMEGKVMELKKEKDLLGRRHMDRDNALRKVRKAVQTLDSATDQLPPLKASLHASKLDITALKKVQAKTAASVVELKKDTDILINSFLKEEKKGGIQNELFKASYEEAQALEDEVGILKQEEAQRLVVIRDVETQRNRIARVAADTQRKVKLTEDDVAFKHVIVQDLKRTRKEVVRRYNDFQQLYQLVKNQRNKFVSLVAVAGQGIGEFKEKVKILTNEMEILQAEEVSKRRLLERACGDHQQACSARDTQRGELNKQAMVFKKKQSAVDEQIAEIDKLNAVINAAERDMLKLRKEYEGAVEDRNHTGIMLIDRNDELCILYEKANTQEEVMRKGQTMLHRRQDDIRLLKLEVAEGQRRVLVTGKLRGIIPGLDLDMASLQKQLLETRRSAEQLALQLESPDNKTRWRRLPGKIPGKDELRARISQLHERLDKKEDSLLDKHLILEEIASLSARLRNQAAEDRENTLELAQKVNDYQIRLRGMTRRMMATVSELSMYQAHSIKLSGDKEALEEAVMAASDKLQAGEAPTEDVERDWQQMERDRTQLWDMKRQAEMIHQIQDDQVMGPPSLAESRPNAYIPEDLGIPKPYGGFAPFKPTEPGSSMRHIRVPNPGEIVI